MANIKITELNAAGSLAADDVLPVVDISTNETKKITSTNLFRTLPNGTAAAPALAFSSDQANGIYLAGTDTVGITTGGTQRVTVDASGNVTISGDLTVQGATTTVESTTVTIDDKNLELGSVASPSNTTADGGGITLKGATDKTITWVNSTGAWTFNQPVSVTGDLTIPDKIIHSGDTNTFIRFPAADTFSVDTAGAERLRIDSAGNVGIGTASPNSFSNYKTLTIQGTTASGIDLEKADGTIQARFFGDATGVQIGAPAGSVRFQTGGTTERMRINSSGNVGIGTSSPAEQLHLNGGKLKIDTTSGARAITLNAPTNGCYVTYETAGTAFADIGAEKGALGTGSVDDLLINVRGSRDFLVRTNSAERLRIDSSGNVGIGTSSPQTKLHLSGTTNGAQATFGTSSSGLKISTFQKTGNDAGVILDAQEATNGTLAFNTRGTERLRVDSSGRLLVGTTSGDRKLVVEQANSTAYSSTDFDKDYHSIKLKNSTNDKSAGIQFSIGSNGEAAITATEVSDGATDLCFGTRGGGTRAERMRIDSSGRLLVGTSTSRGTHGSGEARLQIEGTNTATAGFSITRTDNGSGGPTLSLGKTRNGSVVQNGDNLGALYWQSDDGTDLASAACSIHAQVDGTPGANDMPGSLVFSTTSDGASSPTERLRLTSSGRLGINTSSPETFLHVDSSNDAKNIVLSRNGGVSGRRPFGIGIGGGSDATLRISCSSDTSGANAFDNQLIDIDSSGRVLLGTTTEGEANADDLTVATSGHTGMTIRSGTANRGNIYFSDGTSGDAEYRGYVTYDHDGDKLSFGTANANRILIDSAGKVGIGTNSVSALLHLKGTGGAATGSELLRLETAQATGGNWISFNDPSARKGYIGYKETGNDGIHIFNEENSFIALGTNGTERVRIDNAGRMLLQSSAAFRSDSNLQIKGGNASSVGSIALASTATNPTSGADLGFITITDTGGNRGAIISAAADGNWTSGTSNPTRLVLSTTSTGASNPTERLRIDSSGNLLVGTTTLDSRGVRIYSSGTNGFYVRTTSTCNYWITNDGQGTGVGTIATIYNDTTVAGSITVNSNTTAFNTGSDYRLKENVVNIIDGITRVKQLSPKRFNFIIDADRTVDGFLAHEAQTVIPEAVTGEKDGDEMQCIDQSKLVPLLTAALQEAIAKIETLETKVAALEAG